MKKLILLLMTSLLCASIANAGLLKNYAQLLPMDLDEMNSLVKKKIAEYKKDRATEILKEAVQAVYSRPNEDRMVEKVIPPLRNELDEADQWEHVIDALVQEAVGAHKNPKAFKPVVLNTYDVFLENIVADFKPFAEKPGHERKTLEKIRDAKIEQTKDQVNERKLRGVPIHKSPSEVAGMVLEEAKKAELQNSSEQAAANEADKDLAKDDGLKMKKNKNENKK